MSTFITYNVFLLIWVLALSFLNLQWKPSRWMRFAWLAGPVVALVALWIPESPVLNFAVVELPEVNALSQATSSGFGMDWSTIYLFVGLLFAAFSVKRIVDVIRLRSKATPQGEFLSIQKNHGAFSFFGWIFIPEGLELEMQKCILTHEKVHVSQKHSWDVLYVEILTAVLWLNPAVYLMKRGLSVVHEYEADHVSSSKWGERFYYNALLSASLGMNKVSPIVHPFSQATIKTRIHMLNNKKSPRSLWIIPIALLIGFVGIQACTKKSEAQENVQVVLEPDKQAEFPGGMEKLIAYIGQQLKYPEEAKKADVQGMVAIAFVIDAEGNISDVEVVKSLSKECDAAALEVVEGMPKWNPAMVGRKAVTSKLTLPIRFQLDD